MKPANRQKSSMARRYVSVVFDSQKKVKNPIVNPPILEPKSFSLLLAENRDQKMERPEFSFVPENRVRKGKNKKILQVSQSILSKI